MDKQNTRNPTPSEIVGSVDLRESFRDHDRIRGSFFINSIEIHQLYANSPASVVSQINAKTGAHFVTAEIDDGGHLVLIDKSGADILIAPGSPWQDPPPASTGDAARDIANHLTAEKDKRDRREHKDVLEALGLPASKDAGTNAPARPGFEAGRSAEDRRKAYEEAANPNQPANPTQPARTGVDKRFAPQIPSNPTPGVTGAGGQLDDGRGRSGTGGGQGETSAATIQDQHNRAAEKPAPVPGA